MENNKLVKMSENEAPLCSDDEILTELRKLGYNTVPPEIFHMMKQDISLLLMRDKRGDTNNRFPLESVKNRTIQNTSDSVSQVTHSMFTLDIKKDSIGEFSARENTSSFSSTSKTCTNQSIDEMADQSTSSTDTNSGRKIKRKVMRHEDGQRVVTEEFIPLPKHMDTSYADSPKSSSDDSSLESSSSTGSTCNRSSISRCSFSSRCKVKPQKKNDPVSRYGYYKKFWDEFKPPGEKNHNKLRWAVRDKMLDYSL